MPVAPVSPPTNLIHHLGLPLVGRGSKAHAQVGAQKALVLQTALCVEREARKRVEYSGAGGGV